MVVDTSALVAILLREIDAEQFDQILSDSAYRLMSAVTRVELSLVIEGRYGERGRRDLEALLVATRLELVAVTPQQAEVAIEAFRRFGKGRHQTALNIGDCFAYALAKTTGMPLLFKGGDFALTDIRPALTIIPPP
jgi:ribonuclease VapC